MLKSRLVTVRSLVDGSKLVSLIMAAPFTVTEAVTFV